MILRHAIQLLRFIVLLAAGTHLSFALVVDTLQDQLDDPAGPELSLREAIRDAGPGEVITFDPALSGGTILLAGLQLDIQRNVTIDASALVAGIIINADRASRVVLVGADAEVVLRNLTLTGGYLIAVNNVAITGAGIKNLGSLRLERCVITDNWTSYQGGGIYHEGPALALIESTLHDNEADRGGGLYCRSGSLTVESSTISANEASTGAGIYASGASVVMGSSTLAENRGGSGSGLHAEQSQVAIRYCTISGNTATGRGSGLVLNQANAFVVACVIAGNPSPDQVEIDKKAGSYITGSGPNLIGSNVSVEAEFPISPLVGSAVAPLDPLLTPLAAYGGLTGTMVPLPGSPALDAATQQASTPAWDQRGAPRPVGAGPDLGAVEYDGAQAVTFPSDGATGMGIDFAVLAYGLVAGADGYQVYFGTDPDELPLLDSTTEGRLDLDDLDFDTRYFWRVDAVFGGTPVAGVVHSFTTKPVLTVNTNADQVDPDDGLLSLREAIIVSNALPGLDRIEFDSALDGEQISMRHGAFVIDSPLLLDAAALPNRVALSGGGATRIFQVNHGHEVLIRGVTIRDGFNGQTPGSPLLYDPLLRGIGGAIHSSGILTLDDVVFRDNTSEEDGGAIYALRTGSLTILGCSFINNGALDEGGALYNSGGVLLMVDSLFSHNAAGAGGALYLANGDSASTLRNCTITDNRSLARGGGLVNVARLVATGTTIARNLASYRGGGIFNRGTIQLSNVTIAENRADDRGGGLSNEGTLSLMNVTVTRNTSSWPGGGIYYRDTSGSLHLQESIVAGNRSDSTAGDIDTIPTAPLTVAGNNLIGSNEDVEAHFPAGPLAGTPEEPLDPLLSPLQNHGGKTATCVPLGSSLAIDRGDFSASGAPLVDQRGEVRPAGAAPDLGAVELSAGEHYQYPADGLGLVSPTIGVLVWQLDPDADFQEIFFGTDPGELASLGQGTAGTAVLPLLDYDTTYYWRVDSTAGGDLTTGALMSFTTRPTYLVTTVADAVDGVDGELSLREAVLAANHLGGTNLIRFDSALEGQTILLTGGALRIDSSLTIDASELDERFTISGNSRARVFEINFGSEVWLRHLVVTGGKADSSFIEEAVGGGILSNATSLRISDCVLTGNAAPASGGGLYDSSNRLTIEDSVIAGNSSNDQGGGVFSAADVVTIADSTFSQNTARLEGGGAYLAVGAHTLDGSLFVMNTGLGGAGLHALNTTTVTSCEFLENEGAGAFVSRDIVADCRFTGNRGTGLTGNNLTATRLTVERNRRGGIVVDSLTLSDSRVANNSSPEKGGGVSCGKASTILGCTIWQNSSGREGGGIAAFDALTLASTTIAYNASEGSGGGLWTFRDYPTILTNCTVFGNSARQGGGIYHDRRTALDLRYTTVTRNAAEWGGGLYLNANLLILENTIVAQNLASRQNPDLRPNGTLSVTVLGRVLIGNNEGAITALPVGPLVGTPDAPRDPLLAHLGDYGGGTPTAPPLPGSPAINAGLVTVNLPATDQRNETRPLGGAPDLGAVEIDPAAAFYSPGDFATEVSLSPVLHWPSANRAGTYHVYLGLLPDSLEQVASVQVPSAQLTGLSLNTTYYWRVDFEGSPSTSGPLNTFTTVGPLVVTSAEDTIASADGFLSLREAVLSANSQPGPGLIVFDPSLDGARLEITSPLVIDSDLEIDATALPNGLTIAAAPPVPDHRHFVINAGSAATFRGVTLVDGRQTAHVSNAPDDRGGAIYSLGDLTLTDMVFKGNFANSGGAAVYAGAGTSNSVSRCLFTGNRAGSILELAADASMTIRDSTFRGNLGGAVANNGDITIERCAFEGNFSEYPGGAFHHNLGSALLRNSTFFGNGSRSIGGAIHLQRAGTTLTIDHCTIVGNESENGQGGGGISVLAGALILTNSIVANNISRWPSSDFSRIDPDKVTVELGLNLIGNNLGVEAHFPEGPLAGTPLDSLDPLLAPLGDYGGITPTMALRPGSPAIDAAEGSFPHDQRGEARPWAGGPDLGAFELGEEIFVFAERASQPEGDAGSAPVVFTVARPPSSVIALALNVEMADGTDPDRVDVPAAVTFPAGSPTATVVAQIAGDTDFEADELVAVKISGPPPGIVISRETASTTIKNDDRIPLLDVVILPGGDVRLEWISIPEHRYTVRYTDDLVNWITAVTGLLAEGSRTAWIDAGPPSTASHPSQAVTRYYQLTEEEP